MFKFNLNQCYKAAENVQIQHKILKSSRAKNNLFDACNEYCTAGTTDFLLVSRTHSTADREETRTHYRQRTARRPC